MSANDFPSAEVLGHVRYLACIPSDPVALAREPRYGAAHPVPPIPEIVSWLRAHGGHIDLTEVAHSPLIDQDGKNSCASFSGTSTYNLAWNLSNQDAHAFDPWFLYAQVNGGRDAGSRPLDNLKALQSTGICLVADNPQGFMYQAQLPRTCYDAAARFRAGPSYQVASPEEVAGALALLRPVAFGMALPANYMTIDQGTGMFVPGGMGGLHGMMVRGLLIHPAIGRLVFIVQNSWSGAWGIRDARPFGFPTADALAGCVLVDPDAIFGGPYFEGYVIAAPLIDPQSSEPVQP